jgi:hypothetical protein
MRSVLIFSTISGRGQQGLLDGPGQPDSERVGLEAGTAPFAELEVVVQLVHDILGQGVVEVILEQG